MEAQQRRYQRDGWYEQPLTEQRLRLKRLKNRLAHLRSCLQDAINCNDDQSADWYGGWIEDDESFIEYVDQLINPQPRL